MIRPSQKPGGRFFVTTRCHGSLCTAKSRASQNGPIEIQECSIALALALLGRNDIYFRRRDFKGRRSWLRSARSSSPAKRCSRSSASRQFGQLRGLSEWQSFPTPSRQACSETGQHLEHGLGRSRARALEGTGFEPSVPGGPRRLRRLRLRPARRRNPTTARFSARFVAREFQRPGSRLLAIDPLRHLKKIVEHGGRANGIVHKLPPSTWKGLSREHARLAISAKRARSGRPPALGDALRCAAEPPQAV
jgi:hypothetical protein